MNVTYGVQTYAWGKVGRQSLVGLFKENGDEKFTVGDDEAYAEMWIGSHPKCMSYVGGEAVGEIPYLLKVLSIEKALSIQAHPTKEHAEVLHKKDPVNYPDDNHKPELLVALTKTEALVCFRKVEEIEAFSKKYETLAGLNPEGGLKGLLAKLLSKASEAMVAAHKNMLEGVKDEDMTREDKWFLKLEEQFPGDTGSLMVYVLNLVEMLPGEGVFLKPNEPHAYLYGNGVEIMAKSDNVVRAGLTPKFKDAETLLEMLTYNTGAISDLMFKPDASSQITTYTPPPTVPEFQLKMVKLGGSFPQTANLTIPGTPGGSIILIVKGWLEVNGVTHPAGAALLFPTACEVSLKEGTGGAQRTAVSDMIEIDAATVLFVASTNCSC
eukprot:TRINITY_DN11220_c0_g1_i1.p1 TRINITY_DN11220_c0_g1~~TRINITY_DN11220_c0_g1_i1.p1  ORF type:complete len:381 (+),score=111.28 TRINITY_DN11220_c0_g1_i1:57-1199(+)